MRICNLWINQKKLADLKFVDSHISEICGFAIAIEHKNLQIFSFKKHLRADFCKFAISVNDTSCKLLPLVSTTVVVYLPPVSSR
jgi:hypothetical protein